MTGDRRVTQNVPFTCSAVGRRVTLTIHTVEPEDRAKSTPRIEKTECDHCHTCTVGVRNGEAWAYHWSNCVHPVLKRQT